MDRSDLGAADYLRSGLTILVFFVVLLIATPVILLLLLVSAGRLTNFVIARLAPLMMKPVLFTLGIKFRISQHGPPLQQPAVYIINHSSTLDLVTLLALGLPRVRFVAKWELQYNPLFFLLGRLTGQVFIRRQRSDQAVTTLQKAYSRIRRQRLSILLAPEGSRKHEGIIGPFKKGPFHIALALGYPIIPIYFEGNRELSAGGSLLARPGHVTAHIYPPIDTTGWTVETIDEHVRAVRHRYLDWAGVEHDPVDVEIREKE